MLVPGKKQAVNSVARSWLRAWVWCALLLVAAVPGTAAFAARDGENVWDDEGRNATPQAPKATTARVLLVEPVLAKGMLVRSSDGEIVGFLRDLTARALETQGVSAIFGPADSTKLDKGVWPQADAVVALSITDYRTKIFEFSAPIVMTPGVIVMKSGTAPPTTIEEIRKLRIAVAINGAGHQWCLENSVDICASGTMQEALMAVVEDRADACITTQFLWRAHAKMFGVEGLVDHEVTAHPFQRVFAMAVAPEAKWLVNTFNAGLASLRDSGEYDRIYAHWLGNLVPRPLPETVRAARRWVVGLAIATFAFALGMVLLARILRQRSDQLGHQSRLHRALAEAVPTLAYAYYVGKDGTRRRLWSNSQLAEWNRLFPWLNPGMEYAESFIQHIHPDDAAQYDRATEASSRNQSRFHAEFRMSDVTGRYHSIVSICTPTHVEGGTVWQGLLTDRTELREFATMADVAERNYRTVFDRCHDAAMIIDSGSGAIIECNDRACALYRLEKDKLLARTLHEISTDADAVLQVSSPAEIRQTHRTFDGASIVAEVSISRIDFGGREATLTLIRDATERTRGEELARSQRDSYERSNRLESLGRTSGGAAHAFNNYLTAIIGNIELTRMEAPPGWNGHTSLDRASESAARAAALAKQMLLAAGRGSMHRSLVALDRLVEETWSLLRAAVPSRIQLVQLRTTSSPVIYGEPEEFRQALINLVFNAADSIGDREGRISVSAGVTSLSRDQLSAALVEAPRPGPHAYLEVVDDGPGVPPEVQARIFEPFFSTRSPGRGLGLSVTLGIARRFGGGVEFINRRGQERPGVTVRVVIPVHKPTSMVEATPENHVGSATFAPTIPAAGPVASPADPSPDTRA